MTSGNLIEIASFSFPLEAQIAKASLEAADIPVYITDEQTINMQWLLSNALGGVRLLVPEEFAVEAKELISRDFSEDLQKETEIEVSVCPECNSSNVEAYTIGKKPALVVFLLLGFPLFFYKHGIKCNDCGKISKTY